MPAPPCGNYGDVNGDGDVNIDDVVKVALYINNPTEDPLTSAEKTRADVDGDGEVTQADQDLIHQYYLKQINTFPVCSSVEHMISFSIPVGATLIVDGGR